MGKENRIIELIRELKDHSEGPALRYRNRENEQWEHHTWPELGVLIDKTSNALLESGTGEQENIGIYAQNMPEWTIADLAIMGINAVTIPIYATNTAAQARYIIDEAKIRTLFVGDEEQYMKALEIYSNPSSTLEKIILFNDRVDISASVAVHFTDFINIQSEFDGKKIEERRDQVKEDDLATIIYTSGTTGEPKGVMLTHGNFNQAFRIHDMRLHIDQRDHSLCFLPLSHVFERAWSLYALNNGVTVSYLEDPKRIIETLSEVRPTTLCSVPRLYQKAYHTIKAQVNKSSVIKKALFNWALNTGHAYAEKQRLENKIPLMLKVKHAVANRLVHRKIRNIFGGRLRLLPCAGAPLSGEITSFFHALGMPILIGYGLTETCATVSVFPDKHYKFGTVGPVMPEVEVKLGPDNEIWVKGKTVMKGYYLKPEETEKVFAGGWFRTGDVGELDDDGHITITDRIKDLMKTSGGKYVAPQPIESLLTNDNLIEQAILIGDDKPYVTALLVPNFEILKEHARSLNINYHTIEELIEKSHIRELYEEKLEQLQKSLANFERIKKFRLLPEDFSMQLGELTPTLKIRRQIIIQHFSGMIDEMYAFA
jgi:long-chain acyl-CoA synthetase